MSIIFNLFDLFNWKKRHINKKIRQMKGAILEITFQQFELRTLREDIRTAFDRLLENSRQMQTVIDNEKASKKPNEEKIKIFSAQIEQYKPDLEQRKKQLDDLDSEIDGDDPKSCANRLAGLATLIKMFKNFKKTL